MAANYAGTRGTYSVHVTNQNNVINVRSNDVILPVLTSWHTQREQTIAVRKLSEDVSFFSIVLSVTATYTSHAFLRGRLVY